MIQIINPSEHYLQKVAEVVCHQSQNDITHLKVILPTVAACAQLQHILISNSKEGACFLPQIVPIINVGIGSEGVYNIPKESLEPISFLEQKILISQIIREEQSDITISQSLALANHIIRLFDELTAYNIGLSDLATASVLEDAEHWQYMLGFLLKIHDKWLDIQGDLQKTDMSGYRQNMLQTEIDSVRNGRYVIMAGIIPRGVLIQDLAKVISESQNSVLVLPQMELEHSDANVPVTHKKWVHSLFSSQHRHPRVSASRPRGSHESRVWTEISELKLEDDVISHQIPGQARDDDFVRDDGRFDSLTTPTLLLEAEAISSKAQEWLKIGLENVTIVTQNQDLIHMVSALLDANDISNININGYMVSHTKIYEFFLLLIETFDSEYGINLENLIALLKTSYLYSEEMVEFEYKVRKAQISSDEELQKFLCNVIPAEAGIQKPYNGIRNIIESGFSDGDIVTLLKSHIKLAEKLAPSIWNNDEGKVLAELLYDLLQIENLQECNVNSGSRHPEALRRHPEALRRHPGLDPGPSVKELGPRFRGDDGCNVKDYIELLEQTISGARFFKKLTTQKVLFMSLEDASLGGYQNIICADMNEGSMPRSIPHDPWMNPKMRLSTGLPDTAETIGIDWYYFSNLLIRKNVYLTRSSKVRGVETLASRFWKDFDIRHCEPSEMPRQSHEIRREIATPFSMARNDAILFPSKISATNFELLIRNPYGFYAKYILGLRKLENVFEQNNLAKFGNFLHKVIEKYTKEYESSRARNDDERYTCILQIGKEVASEYSSSTVNLWWPKFSAAMKEFIEFDEERRKDGRKIFAEIYGEMPIKIGDKTILITAIADRVELDSAGNVYLLDYKTGTLPTKQDILRGISVQMLIEAMIVDADGFKDLKGRPCELTYVKIASRKPYIETVTYNVSELDLAAQKDGLMKILEYYMQGNFLVNDNPKFAPKYDDYKHLARKA